MTAHNPHGGQKQRRGKAGSLSSSGLRHEVQDSLSELERLIEQQHRQVCFSHTHCIFPFFQKRLPVQKRSFASSIACITGKRHASPTLWRHSGHVLHARTGVPNSMLQSFVCMVGYLACSTLNSSCSKGHSPAFPKVFSICCECLSHHTETVTSSSSSSSSSSCDRS